MWIRIAPSREHTSN